MEYRTRKSWRIVVNSLAACCEALQRMQPLITRSKLRGITPSEIKAIATMCKILITSVTLFLLGVVFPAIAQGPRPGDMCSDWVVCPGGVASSGIYPECFCNETKPPPPPTCENDFFCPFPGKVSGTWPNCSCDPPPPPPPPKCGRCEILMGDQCIPITCRE